MALKTYISAGVYDDHIGTTATLAGTNATLTPTGVFSATFTALNTTNKTTGVWIYINIVPSASNIVVTLQESTVDTACTATLNRTDCLAGWNYVRFPTPYQWTTTAAGAYRFKATNASNSGQLRLSSSLFAYTSTYDTATTLGSTDNLWVGGFHNSGLTTSLCTLSGTFSLGDGTDKTMSIAVNASIGAAITVGNGGTVKFDDTASVTATVRGSILITAGGLFDKRASATKSIISTLIFDNETTNGDYGIISAATTYGGQFLLDGATYDIYTTYASGVGTAADPLITSIAWDADVGDQIVIGGGTDYSKNEVRYIKTRNSSTSFVLSTTVGGAEAALSNTHAVGSHICNMQRNSIVTALNTARGYWIYNNTTSGYTQSLNYCRLEYSSAAASDGINLQVATGSLATADGMVVYNNSVANRSAIIYNTITNSTTATGIIAYNTLSTTSGGFGALSLSTTNNHNFTDCFFFNGAGSTAGGTLLVTQLSSTNNVFTNCHFYGGNATNTAANSAIYLASSGNTFTNCSVQGSRVQGIIMASSESNTFNNCNFGTMATNTIDILITTSTRNTAFFNACSFSSATLLSNYLNGLAGTDIAFQNMDSSTSKHRWYTEKGSFWSSGSGLTDTTVRTASSLALAIKPENNTDGATMIFKIPAAPTSQVAVFGYLYRNATFSSGTLKVDLFLPGTLTSATPDDTVTLATTTGSWLYWNLNAYYSGSVARYATVRITAITSTAGAYAFLDDLYDATTSNKVAGLDLWDEGHISKVMVVTDFSSAVPTLATAAAVAVWSDTDTYGSGEKGKVLADTEANTDVTQAKVDTL